MNSTVNGRKIRLAAILLLTFSFILAFGALESQRADAASVQNAVGYVNAKGGLNIRQGASTGTKIVGGLNNGTKITISEVWFTTNNKTNASNTWYRISANGKSGYVRGDFVKNIAYSAVAGRTTASLNYRNGAGTGMGRAGTFGTNVNLTVLLKAHANGSNVGWYMIKYNNNYYYVCSSWVTITGSIFSNNNGGTSNTNGGQPTQPATQPSTQPTTPSTQPSTPVDEFEESIKAFPEDYKAKLRELHKAHPTWKFVAKETGVDWNSALTKETKDAVSLIYYSYPLSYRDTSSYSFKQTDANRPVRSAASTSAGTVANVAAGTQFTILDEVFTANTGNDSDKWVHVRMQDGTTGYIQKSVSSESYATTIDGNVKGGDLNIRGGAGTKFASKGLAKDKTTVTIVLRTKAADGSTWYKIKTSNGYGYVKGDYVSIPEAITTTKTQTVPSTTTVAATANQDVEYRMGPGDLFESKGKIANGGQAAVISRVKDYNNADWYKLNVDSKIYYAPAAAFAVQGEVKDDEAVIQGEVTDWLNYRSNYGRKSSNIGTLKKGEKVAVSAAVKGNDYVWYRIKYNEKTAYAATNWIKLTEDTYTAQTTTETVTESVPVDLNTLTGTGSFTAGQGTYIAKDGSTWFNASPQVVGYYMDPRNFLNENSIYQFEDLSYQSYQSTAAVTKILSGTALATNGYLASWFVSAGQQNGMSPIALAARARQENGGGGVAITGWTSGGQTYYNPFNIGATTGSNPVMNGMYYAQRVGWNTKQKAINGGAQMIAKNYIKQGQNTIYYQRFNVANGDSRVATHQYMTNITVGYTESLTTKSTYAAYGITNEALVFNIPVFKNMPASTSLPQ